MNIFAEHVEEASQLNERVFSMKRPVNSDWFIILKHLGLPRNELGILDTNSEIVPPEVLRHQGGGTLTFVVQDAVETFELALGLVSNLKNQNS